MTSTDDADEGLSDADEHFDAPATLASPTPADAQTHVAAAVSRNDLVTLFGCCTVEYDGRAASHLGPGERLVVLKPDGTALVHTEEGQQPVNWQPPGATLTTEVVDGELVVRSRRSNPNETLEVRFEGVVQTSAFDVSDASDLSLSGTEEDLRQRILADPDLVEQGLRPLATERQTPAGAVDIYAEDRDGATVVVELKRRRVGPDAVGQLTRYVDALGRDLHAETEIRGILVAPSVTERARRLLAQKGLEFVSLGPSTESSD